jgi:serine/threonine protein kinase
MGGSVKVADFGLAKLTTHTTTAHTGGTYLYMAPECFNDRAARQTDQYSLAITYCELRGGRVPFTGTPQKIMSGHLQGEPDLSMIPEGERPVVLRALDKDPRKRWRTCTEFVEVLAAAGLSGAEPRRKGLVAWFGHAYTRIMGGARRHGPTPPPTELPSTVASPLPSTVPEPPESPDQGSRRADLSPPGPDLPSTE